ncbi:hypothetical protein GCM10008968_00940 [Bacillus horti]
MNAIFGKGFPVTFVTAMVSIGWFIRSKNNYDKKGDVDYEPSLCFKIRYDVLFDSCGLIYFYIYRITFFYTY